MKEDTEWGENRKYNHIRSYLLRKIMAQESLPCKLSNFFFSATLFTFRNEPDPTVTVKYFSPHESPTPFFSITYTYIEKNTSTHSPFQIITSFP